jgi:allantoinase
MANIGPGSDGGSASPDLIVRGRRVITPEGEQPAAIHIRNGVISSVGGFDDVPSGSTMHEANSSVIMPGLVDTHVHINEPGRTEWEGFCSATHAAAAGGVTTIIEMPLNSIPVTTNVAAYREKIAAAKGKLWVDVGFWGGVVPGNAAELRPMWEAGVFGFKCFLVPSGVEEFDYVKESDLRAALPELARLEALLLAHAELPSPIEEAMKHIEEQPARRYATWLASRPRDAEDKAIALLWCLARAFGAKVHIVHLSSSSAIRHLKGARTNGLKVSVETCPHYLTFTAEEIPDGATEFKCAPPIRDRENREKLWSALGEGTIDAIVSDHSPCPPAMKLREEGNFMRAWGGIASLQLGLLAVWTMARSRGYALTHVVKWMCGAPAQIAGIDRRKGSIAVGCDADLVIFDPDAKFRVDPAHLQHRHKLTPYARCEFSGLVQTTFLRGQKVFDRGEFSSAPMGRVLYRNQA